MVIEKATVSEASGSIHGFVSSEQSSEASFFASVTWNPIFYWLRMLTNLFSFFFSSQILRDRRAGHEKVIADMNKLHKEEIKALQKQHEKMNSSKNERIKSLNTQINEYKTTNNLLVVILKEHFGQNLNNNYNSFYLLLAAAGRPGRWKWSSGNRWASDRCAWNDR